MNAQVLTLTHDLSLEEWRRARKKGIGGSDIAAIAGMSPWRSPMAVYLEKVGDIPDQEENEAMYWGKTLESVVADEFSRRTGLKIARKNAILQHPEHPWMLANIDRRIIGQKAGLECKTTSAYGKDKWEDGKVPDMYMLQCQWYMAVTGYESWWIAVLIGGNTFKYKEIARDEEIIKHLIEIGRDFWVLVESRTPPAIDGTESSTSVLNTLFPADDSIDDEIHLAGVDVLIDDFLRAQQMEKEWTLAKNEIANKIKAKMGDYTIGRAGRHKINWKPIVSTGVDTRALKEAGLYERFSKTSTYRRFFISEAKEG